MAEELVMPRLSDTMEEGTISRWLKHEGDPIKRGEPVAEIETDKANMQFDSYLDGVLSKIVVKEGESAPLGAVIAYVAAEGEQPAQAAPESQPSEPSPGQPAAPPGPGAASQDSTGRPAAAQEAPAQPPPPTPEARPTASPQQAEAAELDHGNGRIKASPLARKIAEEHGVDLAHVRGTGPGGRIVREDVEAFLKGQPAPAAAAAAPSPQTAVAPPAPPAAAGETRAVPLTSMQRVIARRMVESKTTVPHFYVTSEVAMDEAMRLREMINRAQAGTQSKDVTVNSLIVRAVALALESFPDANGSFRGDVFELYADINVGVAVAIEKGLVVPVVRQANKKGIREIDREVRELATKAREGKLTPADMQGGTFSISNLGPWDVEEFQAIVDPPQAGILAVGTVKDKPVVVDGQLGIGKRMRITLSADHRILYGVPGAKFLQEVKRLLEHPILLTV